MSGARLRSAEVSPLFKRSGTTISLHSSLSGDLRLQLPSLARRSGPLHGTFAVNQCLREAVSQENPLFPQTAGSDLGPEGRLLQHEVDALDAVYDLASP